MAGFFLVGSISCNKDEFEDIDLSKAGHPRILLLANEEEQIKALIDRDEAMAKIHAAIMKESNKLLGKEPLQRAMIGRRLLSTSRELLKRSFFLSYAYRMTGEDRFLKKAEEELVSVAQFSDWNPSHFLDVAEMTTGMAIGYDWLFENLSSSARGQIRDAIKSKGIDPSFDSKYTWWLNSTNNWNQVCNTGMVYGSLAIKEDYPELADQVINRALNSIKLPMEVYGPDGVYPEGYSYWGYGSTYNALFLSAIEKELGTDNGLSDIDGFLESAHYMKHSITPTGGSFNWGDCPTSTGLKNAMFWFAGHMDDNSVLWSEKQFLDPNEPNIGGIRTLPASLIWGKNISLSGIDEPSEKFWVGQGPNPVAMMRTSWTDYASVYLGFKAGSPSVNHGHMDIGSFVMEAEGVRWAADLGMQNYESLESLGMQIFGKGQDAERWTVFRMNTYSHNVLIVDGEQQRVDGYAKIDKFSDAEDFMFAISDISSVYDGQLKKATRGVGIKNGKYTIIRDEIETLEQSTSVRWNMVTTSVVELGEQEATLIDKGKILKLKVNGPDNLVMKTWSTAPTNNYDAENPGTIMVGFEVEIPANSSVAFEVLLVPQAIEQEADFTNILLEQW